MLALAMDSTGQFVRFFEEITNLKEYKSIKEIGVILTLHNDIDDDGLLTQYLEDLSDVRQIVE